MPQFVRSVAAVAMFAFLVGRVLAPALRGAREGIDRIIAYTDFAGGFASYLFAFVGLSATLFELVFTFRDKRFGISYRVAATVLAMCVVSLVAPAFREPLPERANVVAALASGVLAVLASREAITVPRTRALGVLLACAGTAALLHLAASLFAWYAGLRNPQRLIVFARILATGSVLFDTLAILTAFMWLATRKDRATVWAARVALFVACVLAAGAARGAGREVGPLWQLVAYRALDRVVPIPAPFVWVPYRYVLETSAPLLGLVAIVARRQIPAIVGSLALILLARPSTDVPLSALALTLAALSTPLAARDDRGMWAVLMANSGQRQVL